MDEIILLKLGEIVLKGLNRHTFEERLRGNLRRRLKEYGKFDITSRQSTVYVEPAKEGCDMDGAFDACCRVFGVVSVSRAYPCEKTKEAVFEAVKLYLTPQLQKVRTFKVESKRADKRFPMTSIELSQWVGGEIDDAFPNLTADVHEPEMTVYVEIREKSAYVHGAPMPGAGGLPVGVGGRGVSLLSGGIDSPVATYMMAKRGLALDLVHFVSPPYTSDQARDKVVTLAKQLRPYTGRTVLHILPFTEVQEEIRRKCPEDYFTLLMRRCMMRLSEAVAEQTGGGCLITGECLGQVASQTLDALRVTEDVCTRPVFRPLIGMDKEEIVRISRKIGVFETSILPYEDCCTVFTPRHPQTHPKIEDAAAAEAALDLDALLKRALEGEEKIVIKF